MHAYTHTYTHTHIHTYTHTHIHTYTHTHIHTYTHTHIHTYTHTHIHTYTHTHIHTYTHTHTHIVMMLIVIVCQALGGMKSKMERSRPAVICWQNYCMSRSWTRAVKNITNKRTMIANLNLVVNNDSIKPGNHVTHSLLCRATTQFIWNNNALMYALQSSRLGKRLLRSHGF